MAGDPFTAEIFRWLDRVAADPAIPSTSFRLAYIISQHINRSSRESWPGQDTLGAALGVNDRSVRRLTDPLEERGYLLTRHGKRNSLTYRLAQDGAELSYRGGTEERPAADARPVKNDRSRDPDRSFFAATPVKNDRADRLNLTAEPLIEPPKEPERAARAHATLIAEDFELSAETYDFALGRLGSTDAVLRSKERFVDYYRQVDGKQAKSRDWQAKARLWFDDDAKRFAASNVNSGSRPKIVTDTGSASSHSITDAEWNDMAVSYVRFKGRWNSRGIYGPPPSDPACMMPERFFVKHNIRKAVAA
ncbi:hypothetical protein IVB02_21325 [Bradyrhizobium sp. 166]|uniref:helix-turn-helix domain-containing protein n=1 Tax=Bradyrhizobium sp. 166 TaxID=2782638 RepID=UPI001FFAD173|nr:helix-turn-helix domain-containing protein [Bradyrhizobium sp. 166]MCK1603908.1 hypothetical protein [Bradyrhizobium sp. 166]